MTQKEKLREATMMALRITGIANALRNDAREFDCYFPLSHATELENIANNFLKLK